MTKKEQLIDQKAILLTWGHVLRLINKDTPMSTLKNLAEQQVDYYTIRVNELSPKQAKG